MTGRCDCSEDLLDGRKESLKLITPLDVPSGESSNHWISMTIEVLTKSMKSEQYIGEKFEVGIRLLDEHCAPADFESH